MSGIYITNKSYGKDELKKKFELLQNVENRFLELPNILIGTFKSLYSSSQFKSDYQNYFATHNNLSITYQGDIYNLLEIKQELSLLDIKLNVESEAEVILKGYELWGESILKKINGVFIFAIFDSYNRTIFCARDHIGVKPCYYSWENGIIEICSRLSPLIKKHSVISEEAVAYFLFYGYVPTPISIIEGVNKLHPGHYLFIDLNNKSIKEQSYWDLKKNETTKNTYVEAKEELHYLIKDAVKIRMESNKIVGSFLSGGIDSSIITSILAKLSKSQIQTYTIAMEDRKFDESKIAKEFAGIIGTNHFEFVFKPKDCLNLLDKHVEVYDEPFADSSSLPTLYLHAQSKKYSSIAFTGEGGDENFLSYGQFSSIRKFEMISYIPLFLRKQMSFLINNKRLKNALKFRDVESFMNSSLYGTDNSILNDHSLIDVDKYYKEYKNISCCSVQRFADFSMKFLWDNGYNVKVERASSAYAMNLKSPLLDYRIVDFARRLPINFRLKGSEGKVILKDILEEYIPRNVFEQPKRGFGVPLGSWIKNVLREEIMTTIGYQYHKQFSFIDNRKFELMLHNHMKGIEDNSIYIWRIYILNKWIQKYFA